ncbi:hypothetical protein [Stutzerimonas xanthomarina]
MCRANLVFTGGYSLYGQAPAPTTMRIRSPAVDVEHFAACAGAA